MTPTLLILAIPFVALALCRLCYTWGHAVGYRECLQDRHVDNIKKAHTIWRSGVLAERMRAFSPKNVSKD